MSGIFHRSCYTSRSSGYKYRTLSTNTGERKRRDSREDNTFDRKFKELKCEITSRIFREVNETQRARDHIQTKFDKIDSKINSMLELKNTVTSLKQDLRKAENALADMVVRVDKLEAFTHGSEPYSLRSRKSSFRTPDPIYEEKEFFSSYITHV